MLLQHLDFAGINRLIVSAQKIRYANPSFTKIIDEIRNLNNSSNKKIYLEKNSSSFTNELEFNNIYFEFPNGKEIMKNLNLKIKIKDKIGIKGASGIGKSTLLYLISDLFLQKKVKFLLMVKLQI